MNDFEETLVEIRGDEVKTSDARQWWFEQHARYALEIEGGEARERWLNAFEVHFGAADGQILRDTLAALWAKERSAG